MAWIEENSAGNLSVAFRVNGKRYKKCLGTTRRSAAEAARVRVEENLIDVKRGRLTVPRSADLAQFLLSDGKLTSLPDFSSRTLKQACDEYFDSLPPNGLASETIRIAKIHANHLMRILGKRFRLESLSLQDLQRYINRRARQKNNRNRPISSVTIEKEIDAFRSIWNWNKDAGYVTGEFPRKGVKFPQRKQKTRFQTLSEIMRQKTDGLCKTDWSDLLKGLYLTPSEVLDVLEVVRKQATSEGLHSMVAVAAYTGARRGEIVRLRTCDVDMDNGTIRLREKKRKKGVLTERHVPMNERLQQILKDWLNKKRKSPYLFPDERSHADHVTAEQARDHLKRTLSGSKWEIVRGWHIFRHSFISMCASIEIDQRMIDEWVAHQTDEIRRRYRHLFPDSQKKAIEKVFG